jgi:hypothetical protein
LLKYGSKKMTIPEVVRMDIHCLAVGELMPASRANSVYVTCCPAGGHEMQESRLVRHLSEIAYISL